MSHYDPVIYSRMLTTLTLAFHIIYATIGVGVPMLIALAEWMGIKRKDPHYLLLARRWARGYTITVAVGVVTGTAIGLQLSLLWPSFMLVAGQSIALPLFMETFAFFIEAIFLGIYLYTWNRFRNPMKHFMLLIPVVIGSSGSAFFITCVNAFMNTPRGFNISDTGKLTDVQPFLAMFTASMPTKAAHVLATAYVTASFILGAMAAMALLKGKNHVYYRKALKITMVAGLIFSLATILIGDLSGKYLAAYQPEKLAAGEWHFKTERYAPLIVGGILDDQNQVRYALKIPYALSILAHGLPSAEVQGLNETPKDLQPPLWIHYMFDLMVSIGMLLLFIGLWYVIAMRRRRKSGEPARPMNKLLLSLIVVGAPLSVISIEAGWIYTEVGRQPWILVGFMKTVQGATKSEHVDLMLWIFAALYLVLGVSSAYVLRRMFKHHPVEEELKGGGSKA